VTTRAGLALCLVALALPASAAQAAKDDLDLVSRASGVAGEKGNADSIEASLSGDGRLVAFESAAWSLHPEDTDSTEDIYAHDLATDTVTLVSRAAGPDGVKGNNHSGEPVVSRDGRSVAFESYASNLHLDDRDTTLDAFVRDLRADTTTLVSRATGATGAKGNGPSYEPSLSGDGRFVAFTSGASNLAPGDGDSTFDAFVRDLQTNTTTLVSRATGIVGAKGNGESVASAISDDGRFVAFASTATNLAPGDGDNSFDVFVRDLQTYTTTLVSRAAGVSGAKGNGNSFAAALSADGQIVAFESAASNLHPADGDATFDVFVRDLQTSTTTLASRADGADGAGGNGTSGEAALSADGRFVVYGSGASNLHAEDGDSTMDVFVRDLVADTTMLASRAGGSAGAKGNGDSSWPALSGDGRFVAFESVATNLHPNDGDTFSDVFRRELGTSAPSPTPDAPPPPPSPPPAPPLPPPPLPPPTPLPAPPKPLCLGRPATIVGTAGRNVLRGTPKADVIVALDGIDLVLGRGGADVICAGAGNDRVEGGPGADRIGGGPGNDRLLGGRGNDLLLGGPGKDVMRGGPGRDRMNGGAGRDRTSP
jgi:Tol biopolymer transport system component